MNFVYNKSALSHTSFSSEGMLQYLTTRRGSLSLLVHGHWMNVTTVICRDTEVSTRMVGTLGRMIGALGQRIGIKWAPLPGIRTP